MYGLIVKLTILQGRCDEMIKILKESAFNMPGCLSYVVARDATDENVLWVTEVWDSAASHDSSLNLPSVRNAIPQARAIVSAFDKVAITFPVLGIS